MAVHRQKQKEKTDKERDQFDQCSATMYQSGGLWCIRQAMEDGVSSWSNKAAMIALNAQVHIRTKVMKSKCNNKVALTKCKKL